jgi:hypothetical protein
LIFDRRFKSPLVISASYFDLLVAILNDDSIDFVSVEIDHVLRSLPGFLRARSLHFEKAEVSDASERDDRQDKGISPVHNSFFVIPIAQLREKNF